MLGKLFKHEWKTASKMLLLIHGCMLLFAILGRIFLEVSGGLESETIIAGILIFLMVMVICSTALFTYLYIAYRFYKNVFTDQGYLTNTLPVTPVQIILSKGFVGVIWFVIDIMFIFAAIIVLVANGNFLSDLGDIFTAIWRYMTSGETDLSFWLTLVSMILSPFMVIIQIYFCIAVGNLFSGHKVLGAVGTFIGTYTIQQIIGVVFMALTNYKLFLGSGPNTMVSSSALWNPIESITPTLVLSFIFTVICAAAFFLATKYIMTRKLNLQ